MLKNIQIFQVQTSKVLHRIVNARLIADGYSAIMQGLRKESQNIPIQFNTKVCRDKLVTRVKVTKIAYDSHGVTINAVQHKDGKSDEISRHFDYAIVTLPLGVLKSGTVEFSPKLPKYLSSFMKFKLREKTRAIERLSFGVVDKIFMQFDNKFWPE